MTTTLKEEVREDYEVIKSALLSYDKQSGSRFLDDEAMYRFLDETVERVTQRTLEMAIAALDLKYIPDSSDTESTARMMQYMYDEQAKPTLIKRLKSLLPSNSKVV